MSLIIMPGDPTFNDNVTTDDGVVYQGDLLNRVMTLNLTMARAWSCGGFSVSANNPTQAISTLTQQHRIRQAISEGILIDVTDQPDKGLSIKGSRTTATTMEDTGKKVFITIAQNGGMAVLAPADDKEQAMMDEMVNNGDVVIPDHPIIGDVSKASMSRVKPEDASGVLDAFATKYKVS